MLRGTMSSPPPPSTGKMVVFRATPTPPPPSTGKMVILRTMSNPPSPTEKKVVPRAMRRPPPPATAVRISTGHPALARLMRRFDAKLLNNTLTIAVVC